MTIEITTNGIADFQTYFVAAPRIATTAARIAINQVMERVARPLAKAEIMAQVNYPPGYLDQSNRLYVSQPATDQQLEARLTGRDRATSLARFAPLNTPVSRGVPRGRALGTLPGLSVMVRPGQPRQFRSGFLVQLRNGNIGFAIRLRPGQRPENAYFPQKIFPRRDGSPSGVWLLYGPSVNQVFNTVAAEISPEISSALADEFSRQFLRLSLPGATA